MNKWLFLFLISGSLFMYSSVKASTQDDGDWQVWNTYAAERKINDYLRVTLEEEARWGNDMNRFVYNAIDAGLAFKATDWLDLGGNFRYIVQDDAGEWEHESRPHLNAILKYAWLNLELANRSRFEYRFLTRTKDSWRYRNMSEIMAPFEWASFEVSPFVRQEAFFNFDQDNYNQNRLSAGLELNLIKNLQAEVFYLWQALKSLGKWKDVNVLGTKIKFTF